MSCEGGPGSDGVINDAWVSFADPDDAWAFARTVVEANRDGRTELSFDTNTGELAVVFQPSLIAATRAEI